MNGRFVPPKVSTYSWTVGRTRRDWLLLLTWRVFAAGVVLAFAAWFRTWVGILVILYALIEHGVTRRGLRDVKVQLQAPSHGIAGQIVPVMLEAKGGTGLALLRIGNSALDRFLVELPFPATAAHIPPSRRGLYREVVVEIEVCRLMRSYAFRETLLLDPPIAIAPVPMLRSPIDPLLSQLEQMLDPRDRSLTGEQVVRSVREYVRGDDPRRVHWAHSARARELFVRELEPRAATGSVAIIVNPETGYPEDPVVAEACAIAHLLRDRGCQVHVAGPVPTPSLVGPFSDRLAIDRFFAAVTAGFVPLDVVRPLAGSPVITVDRYGPRVERILDSFDLPTATGGHDG